MSDDDKGCMTLVALVGLVGAVIILPFYVFGMFIQAAGIASLFGISLGGFVTLILLWCIGCWIYAAMKRGR